MGAISKITDFLISSVISLYDICIRRNNSYSFDKESGTGKPKYGSATFFYSAGGNVLKNLLASLLAMILLTLSIFAAVQGARILSDVAQFELQHRIVIPLSER